MLLIELFDKIKSTSKSSQKKELLSSFGLTTELETILKYALNYDIVFNLTSASFMSDCSWWEGDNQSADDNFPWECLSGILEKNGTMEKVEYITKNLKFKSRRVINLFAAIIDKDLKCGMSVKTVNSVFKGLIKSFDIMLAHAEDKEVFERAYTGIDWVYVNLKIDGIRCLAFCNSKDDIQFYTRGGKDVNEFLIENIKKDIQSNYEQFHGKIIDGEIYCSDFQKLMNVVNRKKITKSSIEIRNECKYIIFDIFSNTSKIFPLERRIEVLNSLTESKYVQKMKYSKFKKDFNLLRQFADSVISKGHEGIIIKHPQGIYEDKRSQYWMKMKDAKTVELEILGYTEGTGKYIGMLGSLALKLENGGEVDCGSGFTDDERKLLWERRTDLRGKVCEVKYMEETKDSSLRHPVFIRLRDDLTKNSKENENA